MKGSPPVVVLSYAFTFCASSTLLPQAVSSSSVLYRFCKCNTPLLSLITENLSSTTLLRNSKDCFMLGAQSSSRSHILWADITRSTIFPLKSLTISDEVTCAIVCRNGNRNRVPPSNSFGTFLRPSRRYADCIPSNVSQNFSSSLAYISPGYFTVPC